MESEHCKTIQKSDAMWLFSSLNLGSLRITVDQEAPGLRPKCFIDHDDI
jgi:hypothetical protein